MEFKLSCLLNLLCLYILILVVQSEFVGLRSAKGGLRDGEQEDKFTDETTPFASSCKIYEVGKPTDFMKFEHEAKLAFFPLTVYNTTLLINIFMPARLYKVTIDSSNMILEKCRPSGTRCTLEETAGVGITPYIEALNWNEVTAIVNQYSRKIAIKIADIQVMSTMIQDMDELIQTASWSVRLPTNSKSSSQPGLYKVQYKCQERDGRSDFDTTPASTTHTNKYEKTVTSKWTPVTAPHVYTTQMPDHKDSKYNNDLVGLIVGLAIAALLLVGLSVLVYRIMKKRKSANISEKSNLTTEQKEGRKTSDTSKGGIPNKGME